MLFGGNGSHVGARYQTMRDGRFTCAYFVYLRLLKYLNQEVVEEAVLV